MVYGLADRDVERFRTKIDSTGDGCWLWTAGTDASGYGKFGVWRNGRTLTFKANRLALALDLGRELTGWALHGCDNPPCCRIGMEHVYEGDGKQNTADAIERGRFDGFTAGPTCGHGHLRTPANTREYEYNGQMIRRCRDCERERPRTRSVTTHGTRGGYVRGCRCETCTTANRLYRSPARR
jgi:hypothetical protein